MTTANPSTALQHRAVHMTLAYSDAAKVGVRWAEVNSSQGAEVLVQTGAHRFSPEHGGWQWVA